MRSADEFLERCNALMDGQTPHAILQKALQTLEDRDRWTSGVLARDRHGRPVRPEDPRAVAWCLDSAVAMACNVFGILPPYFMALLDQVAAEEFGHNDGAATFNDHFDHDSVVVLVKMALHRVKE